MSEGYQMSQSHFRGKLIFLLGKVVAIIVIIFGLGGIGADWIIYQGVEWISASNAGMIVIGIGVLLGCGAGDWGIDRLFLMFNKIGKKS